jgi:hypothetical protein
MKEKILYVCEICGDEYTTKESAISCEEKGVPDLSRLKPGLIYGDCNDSMYPKIVFSVYPEYLTKPPIWGHYIYDSKWACRDNGAGDSLGESKCGGNMFSVSHIPDYRKLDMTMPCFKRMVKYLESVNITPYVWDKENMRSIPLSEINHSG